MGDGEGGSSKPPEPPLDLPLKFCVSNIERVISDSVAILSLKAPRKNASENVVC